MFFKKIIACVSFIALATTPANAANWEFVSADVADSDYYIDRDSIRSSGGFLYIWAKIDASRNNTVKWNIQLDHLKIHCQSRKMRKLELIRYDKAGNVMESLEQSDYSGLMGMTSVAPESISEAVLAYVCG